MSEIDRSVSGGGGECPKRFISPKSFQVLVKECDALRFKITKDGGEASDKFGTVCLTIISALRAIKFVGPLVLFFAIFGGCDPFYSGCNLPDLARSWGLNPLAGMTLR